MFIQIVILNVTITFFLTWTRGSGSPNFAASVSRAAMSGY